MKLQVWFIKILYYYNFKEDFHVIPKTYQTKDCDGTFWNNSWQASELILYDATY